MNDFIFIFLTISVVTGLIYFLYRLMLGSDGAKEADETELQITSQDILEQLKILYRQKKYNIVESLSKKYLEKKPKDDDIRIVLARAFYAENRIYEAIEQLKIILKHQPENVDKHIFLANCYADVQKPMKAITVFQEILEQDSSNVVAIKELARLYFITNQKLSAIKMYKRLEEFLYSNPEKISNKKNIAEMHVDFKEYKKAIEEYLGVLEIYPEDILAKKRLIELYQLISDFTSVIDYSNEIVATSNSDADVLWALNILMDAYSAIHNYEKALEYANLIKVHPLSNQAELGSDIANILLQKGQISDCILMLEGLIEEDPSNIDLKKALAEAYAQDQDFSSAVNIYKKILDEVDASKVQKIHREISDIYANWAMSLFSSDDSSECFKKFAVALEYYTQNPNIFFLIGNVNKLIKNFNEAISQYKKAIELDDENAQYYYAMAECYEEIDSVYEQKKALIEGLNYDPDNALAYYKIGVIFYSQNDSPNAVSHLRRAVHLDENFVEAKHKLALILEHMGNKKEAIEIYESILKLEPSNEEIINNLKMLK